MKIMDFSAANCKNCYKCVRNCSVKAIKIINDQAEIDVDRCIACGECFMVCPQNARNIVSDLHKVKTALLSCKKTAVSIAPSYKGIYKKPGQLVSALKKLGFHIIEETAIGAQMVTECYKEHIKEVKVDNMITSCCPTVNLLIEKYYPNLIPYLMPYVSPMVAHSKKIKSTYGQDCFVTFIGPCISKKREAYFHQQKGEIDAVLTFEEIESWLNDESIDLGGLEETEVETLSACPGQRYPIENGILNTLDNVYKDEYIPIKVAGLDACHNLFRTLSSNKDRGLLIEANACNGSCLGGPSVPKGTLCPEICTVQLMNQLKQMSQHVTNCYNFNNHNLDLQKYFLNKQLTYQLPPEEDIFKILNRMGKYSPSDELNCSACGYDTCRDKALAVYSGMSHPEMCLPYMRSKAERITNSIFEHSPNIIILLDEDLKVMELNPTAEKLFLISADTMRYKHISYLINSDDFERVKETKNNIHSKRVFYKNYGLTVNQTIMYLPNHNIFMSIMVNMTEEENRSKEIRKLKENTLDAAKNVIEKQMRVAQEIASLLGETTAETKVTLTKLQKIVRGEDGEIK